MELRALFIHGVGQQDPDFAHDARRWLRAECRKRGVKPYFLSAHWAPVIDRYQKQFLEDVRKHGSKGNMMQRLVIGTLADALAYRANPVLKVRIFDMLDQLMLKLGADRHEVTVFAHSLGGLIFTDYLRVRPHFKQVRLVTMGCNIGLFTLGQSFDCPVQVKEPGSWVNIFSPRDMLGFPLRVDPALSHVQDCAVGLGGMLTGWTGLSHILYWSDEPLWKKDVPQLIGLARK